MPTDVFNIMVQQEQVTEPEVPTTLRTVLGVFNTDETKRLRAFHNNKNVEFRTKIICVFPIKFSG